MTGRNYLGILLFVGITAVMSPAFGQDGNRVEPTEGQSVKSVLTDIQSKVNNIQTLKADLEFDEKDDHDSKKKKKKKKSEEEVEGINPKWPEPIGRDVERGPLVIQRSVGAYLSLERKNKKAIYVANSSSLWKYDLRDKEARHVPSSWPVINTFVSNALVMNVFVAMDDDTIKFRGTESVDGVPCWVLDGKSPSKLKMVGVAQVKLKMWIGQADGIPRIIKAPSEDDLIIRLKNVELNQPVDASLFQFTPPDGVKTKNILGF